MSTRVFIALQRNRAFDAGALPESVDVVFCFVAVFSALYSAAGARGMSPFNSGLVFLALSRGRAASRRATSRDASPRTSSGAIG